jgi:exonuclease SbcC
MKPLTLTLQAFGPFAGTEIINFQALGENPLFLINGPTGAGKSSILDGICFALYGESTGKEREAVNMRCDYAKPDLLTEIILDFRLGEKDYRIRRLPTQEKPKNRGEGTTTQQTEAYLWRLENAKEGELLAVKKVKEVDAKIQELLGLEADQFRQVMVLPQGKFRELLMANSKDRETIFSQLFQTQIYEQIQDHLKERAKGIIADKQKQDTSIKIFLESANLTEETQVSFELNDLTPRLAIAQAEKEAAEIAKIEAVKHQESGLNLQKQFDNYQQKEVELTAKQSEALEIEQQQQQLEQAKQADKLLPLYQRYQEEVNILATLTQKSAENQQQLTKITEAVTEAKSLYEKAQIDFSKFDQLKKEQIELQQYEKHQQELIEKRKALKVAEKIAKESSQVLQKAQTELTQNQLEKQKLETAIADLNQALITIESQKATLKEHQRQLQDRQQLEDLRQELDEFTRQQNKHQKEEEKQREKLQLTQTELTTMEMYWHLGQAASLAQTLTQDQPCPVCGSCEHPQPAQGSPDTPMITKENLEKAKQELEKIRQKYQKIEQELVKVNQKIEHHQQAIIPLENSLDDLANQAIAYLQTLVDDLTQEINSLQSQQAEREVTETKLATLQIEITILETAIALLNEQVQTDQAKSIQARSIVEQIEKQIPSEYHQAKALDKALISLEKTIQSLTETYQKADQDYQKQQQDYLQCQTKQAEIHSQCQSQQAKTHTTEISWQNALQESCFSDLTNFQTAQLSEFRQTAIATEIESYHAELNALKGGVNQLKTELTGQTLPDIQKLGIDLQEKSQLFTEKSQNYQQLANRHHQLQDLQTKLNQAHQHQAKLDEDYKIYGTLSEVADGKTGNKISLQRFVLGVLLEDVLSQASARLYRMTQGRYRLERPENQRAKNHRASGLEIEVLDEYTGKLRPVSTLSGGESFLAALSLALGLSDTIQSYAGGIQLDTLFIDEGFGSLDSESLELAIRTLMDLQSHGRTIGIISHITELRDHMNLRLDVISSRLGSCVKVIGV